MIRKILFELKCKFYHEFSWDYSKRLIVIANRMTDVYPWDDFVADVKSISEDFNLPEMYVYEDLQVLMPDKQK